MKEDAMDKLADNKAGSYLVPACSIAEDEGMVTLKLEMPGVAREDLEIKIEGNALAVSGRREFPAQRGTYLLRERRGDGWRKLFTMDDSIDRERIEAGLDNGVLTLKLHIKEAAKPRRIEVR
jgi:HSP20 family protein